MRPVEAFGHGLYLAATGLSRARRQPAVRRTFVLLLLLVLLLTLTLDFAGIYALYRLLPWETEKVLLRVTVYFVGPILGLVVLFVAPLFALTLSTLFFPPLAERPYFGVLARLRPNLTRLLESSGELAWTKSFLYTLRRLGTLFGGAILTFVVSLIPIIGPLAALMLHLCLLSWLTTWELLDPYFTRSKLDYEAQRTFLRAHRAEVLGFGLPMGLLLSIPFLGALAFPLAQGAAAELTAALREDV